MNKPARHNPVAVALWANAILLAGILIVLLGRGNSSMLPMAFGADETGSKFPLAPQPIAGGGGIFLMPAQFAPNVWGCYIMDVDRQTLCAYEYQPSAHNLRFVAARNFTYDRMVKNFNTGSNPNEMPPSEVRKLVEKEQQDERVKAGTEAAPPAEKKQKEE